MRMFFGILLALVVSTASAQEPDPMYDKYNEVGKRCPYTASQLKQKNRLADAQFYNNMDDAKWTHFIARCEKNEAHIPRPMEAPANTVVDAPEGEPTRTVKRPATAPKGVHYKCNPRTLMPDENGTAICGPLAPKVSAN
jgi:hypothetical protein